MKIVPVIVCLVLCVGCGAPPPPVETAQTEPAAADTGANTVTADATPTGSAPAASAGVAAAPSGGAGASRPAAQGSRTAAAPARPESPAATSNAASRPAAAAAPAEPVLDEVVVPAGTVLDLEMTTTVESVSSKPEDVVRARLSKAVVIGGRTVLRAGAELTGTVTEVEQAGRVRGRSRVAFRFTSLRSGNERHDIQTDTIAREGEATKVEDAKKVGIGAGVGAAIGGLLGGGSGAAKGAAIGGAAGGGAVLATRGEEVRVGAGAAVDARLARPLTIYVPR